MAIAFRSEAHAGTSTAGTSLTVAKPSGVASGDVLVAAILCGRESVRGVQSGPAGWTDLVGYNDETDALLNLRIWVKVATGSEPADYTWTNTGGGAWAGDIVAHTGVANGGPTGATAANTETTLDTTFSNSGLTTTTANALALFAYGVSDGSSPTRVPMTAHASTTKRGEANSTTTAQGMGVMIATEARASAGATGARNATSAGGNSRNVWASLELIAETAVGGGSAVTIKLQLN